MAQIVPMYPNTNYEPTDADNGNMNTRPPLGHLRRIEIEGLFFEQDRNFNFELDLKEPTLLTGSNGSGKSTVLRILNYIATGAWNSLSHQPFVRVRLTFESDVVFAVDNGGENGLAITLDGVAIDVNASASLPNLDPELITRIIPNLIHSGDEFFNLDTGTIVTTPEIIGQLTRQGYIPEPDDTSDLSDFVEGFTLLFVTDQRLVVSEDRSSRVRRNRAIHQTESQTAAELSAHELSRQMDSALSSYARESQRLDRDFPQRVVSAMAQASEEEVPIERLQQLLSDVEAERIALQRVGLLPKDLSASAFQDLPLQDPNVRPVIETFVTDTKKKFEVLADLRERITLFTEFLNQHYENKRVIPTTRGGFRVVIDGEDDRTIRPRQLSSGEQQILVLAYEILFRAEPGTLILIDEPELSLHVVWQDSFIDDLARMGAVRDLRFILATHSPSLIAGREDLKRSLDVRG